MIDLQKHEERKREVKTALKKLKIPQQRAQVLFFIDNSTSMNYLYSRGKVQEAFERILPLASVLDDDGIMPVYGFNYRVRFWGKAEVNNADGFVNKNISLDNATKYAPIIEEALKLKSDTPTLAIVITDGDNSDKDNATKAIIEASKENIFFQFIGIGNEKFYYLDQIDNMKGRYVDNAGFFKVNYLSTLTDQQLYNQLIKEFPHWLKVYDKKKNGSKGLLGLFGRKK